MSKKFKVAVCQLNIEPNVEKNMANAIEKIEVACAAGANVVVLPKFLIAPMIWILSPTCGRRRLRDP